MNENKINIFKCFIYSITGFGKYRLLLRQSMGKAVGYLILLSFLLSVAAFAPLYSISNEILESSSEFITENMPDFTLSNGRLEIHGEMPIVIDNGGVPMVLDTTPGAEDRILNQYDTVLLFTSDKMVMKNYVNRQEYPLSAFEGLDFTKDSLIGAMPLIRTYMIIILIIMYIFIAIFFVAGKFLAALVVGLIGMIANSRAKTNLSFKSIYKLSIFAMTLPLIIGTVINALMINVPFLAVLFYIGSGIYIFGAINNIKKDIGISGSDNWNFYGSDTFNNNNPNNSIPNDNIPDLRYGQNPYRPPFDNDIDKNNEAGDDSSGDPADDEHGSNDNNDSDVK